MTCRIAYIAGFTLTTIRTVEEVIESIVDGADENGKIREVYSVKNDVKTVHWDHRNTPEAIEEYVRSVEEEVEFMEMFECDDWWVPEMPMKEVA